jgi:chromosome segregation ATPase
VEEVEKDRAELAETVKAEAAEAAQEQSVLQQRLDTANASIAELKARLEENAAVKTMLAEQDAVIASLKADQADELAKERATNQDQIAKLKDELNTSKQARKAKVTATREQIQAQNSALATVQQQLEGVTKSLTETQNKSWDLATANEKLRYRVETVRTGVEKQRATNERRAGEMEKMR